MIRRLWYIAWLALIGGSGGEVLAQSMPVPPCAGDAVPVAGDVGSSLNQLVWVDDESMDDWVPPECTGWSAGPSKALLAAAGRFRMAGDTSMLADHLAKVSSMTDMLYWSHSRGKWRHLFKEAVALSAPDPDARRADFTGDELGEGTKTYVWFQEDNPTAGIVYQVQVHERTPDRLVYESVNVTPIKARLLFVIRPEIAEPREFHQLYFIERESGDIWRFYSLVRMGRASSLAGTTEANYKNRAEAYFRYLARLDMTREPPAAR